MYTIEKLDTINQRFISAHGRLTETDLKIANKYVDLIEKSRDKNKPKSGDIIRYTNEYGDYYGSAHIESITEENGENVAYICEVPYVPFVHNLNKNDNEKIYYSTSGGAWRFLKIQDFVYVGTEKKMFQDWGHCGACADGTVMFEANVSVWEYVAEGNPYFNEQTGKYYTTKEFNKYFVHYSEKPESGYRFNTFDGKAWKNELDFQAWLHTFRGVIFPGNWENQIVVWAWKENKISNISPKIFESINGVEDTLLCNGVQRCKRVYDEENHIVNTYFVWYWEDDDMKDLSFSERAMKQNEIRKNYTFDRSSHRENEYARRLIEIGIIKPVGLSSLFAHNKEV